MDITPLLNELQTMARNGLNYARDPYDIERYERLLQICSEYYSEILDTPAPTIRDTFLAEMGHITPKVGADAAIFDDSGRILLVQRADNAKWCLPCGWVEPNEAPIETAIRETWEETGLEVRPLQLVDVFHRPPHKDYGPHSLISVVYFCEITGGKLRGSHESLDVRYQHIDDVTDWHHIHGSYARAAHKLWSDHTL